MTFDSIVDERTLREIYMPAFEHIVKAEKPTTVMCSYNRLNGTYLSDNKRFLNDVLRDEWGYDGIVVSDWGAVNDRAEASKRVWISKCPAARVADSTVTPYIKH